MANLPKLKVKRLVEDISKEVAADAYNIDVDFLSTVEFVFRSTTVQEGYTDILRAVFKDSVYEFILSRYRLAELPAILSQDLTADLPIIIEHTKEYLAGNQSQLNTDATALLFWLLQASNDVIYDMWYEDTPEQVEHVIVKVNGINIAVQSGYLNLYQSTYPNTVDNNFITLGNILVGLVRLKDIVIK